ncbi:hypothetical protein [Microbacterium sp. KR10-403]|uniref:hypothetical protein n=1 Tax=Microbacterium sp. KR10-403 TaxID=3158581 RepID=UPI0032E4C970
MYTPEWKARRMKAAQHVHEPDGLTAKELWSLIWPELFGEVELDLAQHQLIPDLDTTLDARPWHFVRTAILRLPDIEGTWVQKAVRDVVRRRRADLQDPDGRGADRPGAAPVA